MSQQQPNSAAARPSPAALLTQSNFWNRVPYPEPARDSPDTVPRKVKILFYPALIAMLLLRHHLGVRLIRSSRLGVAVLAMTAYGFVASQVDPTARGMYIAAALTFVAGAIHRLRRSQRQRGGEGIHTYNMGCSYLGLALRAVPGRGNRIERYLDPLVCFLIAAALWRWSNSISIWMLLCGTALFIVERHVHEIQRDYHDAVVKAATIAAPPQSGSAPGVGRSSRGGGGISTGVGKDISAQIAARHKLKRP